MIKTKPFSVIVPIFNEEKNIEILINQIKNSLVDFSSFEIIIINDGSTDQSFKILKNLNKRNIKLLNNKKNMGQSFSIYEGIKNSKYDIIVTIDGDLQNDPGDIPKLLNIFNNDINIKLVSGIRKNRKDNLIKIYSSKIANYIRASFLNDNCPDTGCSLKVFDKSIFLKIDYFDGIHRFIPTFFENMKETVRYVNVSHHYRRYGKSKYGTFKRLFFGILDLYFVKNKIKNTIR
tara:strand:- start:271 stop:969 length:699 start_codon:yes stop_codon:yes gene_type:complete